jgi:hypothetical protein
VSDPSPGVRAVDAFTLDDVFLINMECRVARDLNQSTPITEFSYAYQSGVDPQMLVQERTPLAGDNRTPFHILRYYVTADVRLLKPGVQAENRDPTDDEILAVLKFTLATDYRCPKEKLEDKDAIGAFTRNAHFHAWPFLREEIHTACARLRIPRITLPMLKQDQKVLVKSDAQPKE